MKPVILKRELLLDAMAFLLKDMEVHTKRAYLSVYLTTPDVPPEFMNNSGISSRNLVILDLTSQIEANQEEFKENHKFLDEQRRSGPNAATIKREIQQMEVERQQIMGTLSRIQKRVQGVKRLEVWLSASKSLRQEQLIEMELQERLSEQTNQVSIVDKRYVSTNDSLKKIRESARFSTCDIIYGLMEEEQRMNKFLSEVNLPKLISDTQLKLRDLNKILARDELTTVEMNGFESQIHELSLVNSQLAEQKLRSGGDANMALFRQQASIISHKKDGTAMRLSSLNEDLMNHSKRLKKDPAAKHLSDEDVRRFEVELRSKSLLYQSKAAELSALIADHEILQKKVQTVESKEAELSLNLSTAELKKGIAGFHETKSSFEMVLLQ